MAQPAASRAHITYRGVDWKYVLIKTYIHTLPRRLCLDKIHSVCGSSGQRMLTLDRDHVIFHSGYFWDGASGLTFDTASSMRASLVHDGLYQAMRLGWLPQSARPAADREFRSILRADGMPAPRRLVWYAAVRLLGAPYARPQK